MSEELTAFLRGENKPYSFIDNAKSLISCLLINYIHSKVYILDLKMDTSFIFIIIS